MEKIIDILNIVDSISRIYNKTKKEINKKLIYEGLSISKMKILKLINNKKISATDIKNYMGFSSRTIVTVLDSLERDGLLNRKQSNQDRRIKYVCITDKGIVKLKIAEEKNKSILNELFSSFSNNELEKFSEICSYIEKK
ncbi:MarR family winged helix-turn-helix transcriptional regulator [endosymbiont of Pachyrhynchus infernalis]|uniref:MarR family winged helix-turn-helix transcriptional regulator n=1 Tax=endosymbiont of Pachyrhynchus infernalis TaxID=1971488 RepID=UPI000DC6EB4B|nr:winged helix DNA-binding protein [endosymbiont of Pachyrhynchus infernalis]BBA84775.1 transcriptional regulator MarR family [endosymbiont of Pachyrhynchus infernalis]